MRSKRSTRTGIDLRKESQTSAKHSDSVQFRALKRLKAQDPPVGSDR